MLAHFPRGALRALDFYCASDDANLGVSVNTQPWNFYIVTGEPLNRIRAGNTERMVAGVPQSREFRTGPAFAGQHRDRQVGVAKQLFAALVNAAWSRGLGAVINSQGIMQSPVVREHAGIADDQVIMKSIALGWPDEDFPANAVVSERKTVEQATVFVGFGD